MIMLIRSMAPQVIAVDEIGAEEDVHAVEYAMHCGLQNDRHHARAIPWRSCEGKPVSGQMVEKRRFERYVILRGRGEVEAILDGDGREVGRGT